MSEKASVNGYAWLAVGLLLSSIVSLLDHFAGAGPAASFARGILDGLSVVAFGAAVFILVSQTRRRNRHE
jgi:hypothetical protein